MIKSCYTCSIYSLPLRYRYAIFAVCDDFDFPKVIIIGHWRFTVWTKLDPVSIEKI